MCYVLILLLSFLYHDMLSMRRNNMHYFGYYKIKVDLRRSKCHLSALKNLFRMISYHPYHGPVLKPPQKIHMIQNITKMSFSDNMLENAKRDKILSLCQINHLFIIHYYPHGFISCNYREEFLKGI